MTQVDIRRDFSSEGVRFRFTLPGGVSSPSAFPLDEMQSDVVSSRALRLLESLWYEDKVEEETDAYLVPIPEVYDLDSVSREELGLPGRLDQVEVELRTNGYPGTDDFRIRPVVRLPEAGIVTTEQRHGPFCRVGGRLRLIDEPAAALLRELDEGPGQGVSAHLLHIGRVKELAAAATADLDAYLSAQEIEVPEGIAVEAEAVAPDEIVIRPIPVGSNVDLGEGKTGSSYFETDGDKKRRLVLTEEQRASADEVKRRSRIQGSDVPRFLDNPEAFLPDDIDLDLFSLRVKGLIPRRYNSQPYVEVNKGSSRDWFEASVEIETLEAEAPSGAGGGRPTPPGGGTSRGPESGPERPPGESAPDVSPDEYARLCEEVLETGDRYVMHEGSWIEIDPERARSYLEAWERLEPGEEGRYRFMASNVSYVLDVISNVDELEFTEEAREKVDPWDSLPEYPKPRLFAGQLRSYQEVGYNWLRFLQENDYGGLLADDMGLGKTIQVIALMAHLAEEDALAPTLLVVPAAVMDNWHEEIERFCPAIGHIYHHRGPGRTKDPAKLAMCEIVLTTYATLRRDQIALGQVDWSLVACDEAQRVKNPTAQRTSAVKAMKAPVRLALTGTPVENGLSELWCIVDFAQPGKLGSRKEFREEFERPIQEGASGDGDVAELATLLQQRLTPHYIRRVKEDVLDELPERKPDRRILVPLSEAQMRHYASVRRAVQNGDTIALAALQNLIQICSHPDLHTGNLGPASELVDRCPKLDAALEIVEEVRGRREKVLLYTRYRHMQRILQDCLLDRFGIHAPILNGEVRTGRRHQRVQRFNAKSGFGAMILSPEAAGVGLNIVGANHVIHYTRLWNPAKESQATDRVYRIGQERPVQVYYPIVQGDGFKSVEEHLDELLAEKGRLARDVVWPREDLSVSADMQNWLETSDDA